MEETTTEQAETTDSTADTIAEAPSAVERTFSQEEVNALLAKESSKLKRKLRKQQGQPQSDNTPKPEQNATMEALDKILGRLERLETVNVEQSREQSFNALIGSKEVDNDVRALLFAGYDPENPTATSSMIERFATPQDSLPTPTGYQSPGAPAQSKEMVRGINPMQWTKDDVQVMRQEGRFIQELEKWRSTLPGGGGNLFANRSNKRKK